MASLFAGLMAVCDTTLDAAFGERALIEPRIKPANGRSKADPNRPAVTIMAGWIDPKAVIHPTNLSGHPQSEVQGVSDDKPSIDYAAAALPYDLQQGDWVTRLDTGERFVASKPTTNGFTRRAATLTGRQGRVAGA